MNYAALIVDIIDSKKLSTNKRIHVQQKIKQAIQQLNQLFEDAIKYPLVFSSGDSIQGVFLCPSEAIHYFYLLQCFIYPYQIRFGMGWDTLTIDNAHYDSNMQDGPCYHWAREAIDFAKDNQLNGYIATYPTSHLNGSTINALIQATHLLESVLTRKRQQLNTVIHLLFPLNNQFLHQYYFDIVLNFFGKPTELLESPLQLNFKEWSLITKKINDTKLEKLDLGERVLKEVPAFLAPYFGSTRQNIQQLIKQGQLNEIRQLKKVILNELKISQ